MANTVKLDKVCPGIFGISVRRYQQLARENILPPTDNGYIDFIHATKRIISYYQRLVEGQGSITLTEERARLAKAQADLAILEYQKAKNKLVDAEDVERIWLAMGLACRSRLLAIPVKLAPLLEGKSKAECKMILENNIYEALNELSEKLVADAVKEASEKGDGQEEEEVKTQDKTKQGKKKGRTRK